MHGRFFSLIFFYSTYLHAIMHETQPSLPSVMARFTLLSCTVAAPVSIFHACTQKRSIVHAKHIYTRKEKEHLAKTELRLRAWWHISLTRLNTMGMQRHDIPCLFWWEIDCFGC
jgi:hypothetical protein